MTPQQPDSDSHLQSRRQFIKKTGTVAAVVAGTGMLTVPAMGSEESSSVSVVFDPDDGLAKGAPVRWATNELRKALAARGVAMQIYSSVPESPLGHECIVIRSRTSNANSPGDSLEREAFRFQRTKVGGRAALVTEISDVNGTVYALLELADRVTLAPDAIATIKQIDSIYERPANSIRGIARAFVSDVEDKAWFQDREFWTRYLTMLAAQRFNRFHLMLGVGYDFTTNITDCYFHFAYPFLLSVPGYNVRAVPLPDSEHDSNLEMLRFISDEAARRGLHFQFGIWTHAYVWTNSPKANYRIEGLTPETQAPYCRDALRTLLHACPNIHGITFRIHGESGVPEGNYDLWKTIFDGVAQCGRPVEIDMHAKGMDEGMIDVALGTGMHVNISPKFWAEHMGLPYMQGAIRPQEMPPSNPHTTGFFSRSSGSRSFLRYGYGDLLAEDRRYGVFHRVWPGTQRLLAWGDPETAAACGRVASFCGSLGMELMEPLSFKGRKGSGLPGGRNAYADESLRPQQGDFEKYLHYYRVWGRSLYNPDGESDGNSRWLRHQFAGAAEAMAGALGAAGKILPLVTTAHCPSAANNNYWPEMYFNMPTVDASRRHPYSDTPSPKRLGTVSPLDPEFFLGIDEFADEFLRKEQSGKYTPAWVAAQLDDLADKTMEFLQKAHGKNHQKDSADFRRLEVDATIQAGLGKFFAARFRSGVLFAIHQRTGSAKALKKAIATNRQARDAWANLSHTAKGIYRDDITFGPEYFQRGHWMDRLPALDEDIADMEKLVAGLDTESTSGGQSSTIDSAIEAVFDKRLTQKYFSFTDLHKPPASFLRGQALAIVTHTPGASVAGITLRYRHVNQAETWHAIEMDEIAGGFEAMIPLEYTDSRYALQYYFQIHTGPETTQLYPGLHPGWNGQPYFVVRQA